MRPPASATSDVTPFCDFPNGGRPSVVGYFEFFLAFFLSSTIPRGISGHFLNPSLLLCAILVLAFSSTSVASSSWTDPFRRLSTSPTDLRSSICRRCFPRRIFLRLDLLLSPYLLRLSRSTLDCFFSAGVLIVLMPLFPPSVHTTPRGLPNPLRSTTDPSLLPPLPVTCEVYDES